MTYHTLFEDNITNFQTVNHSSSVQLLQANILHRYRNFFDNFFTINPNNSKLTINKLMRKNLSLLTLLSNEERLDMVGNFISGAVRGNLMASRRKKYIEETKKPQYSIKCNICGASLTNEVLYDHIIGCSEQLTTEIVPIKHGNTLFCLYNKELDNLLTKRNMTEVLLLEGFGSLVKKIMNGECKKVCTKTECLEHKGWRIECLGSIMKNIVKNEKKQTRSYNTQIGFNMNSYPKYL